MKFYRQLTIFLIITCLIAGIPASANETAVSATGVRVIVAETENIDSNEQGLREQAQEMVRARSDGRSTTATAARGETTEEARRKIEELTRLRRGGDRTPAEIVLTQSYATQTRTGVSQEQKIKDEISRLMIELATLQAKLASLERESHDTGQANIEVRKQLKLEAEKLKDKSENLKKIIVELHDTAVAGSIPEPMEPQFYGSGRGDVPMTGRSMSVSSSAPENKIVVIPSAEMNAEDIQNTTEDMKIMMRIFDKEIGSPPLQAEYVPFIQPYIGRMDNMYGSRTGVQTKTATEGFYIADYGALFLMKVDFPLTEPAEAEEEEEIEEDADSAWEQAKQELFSQTRPTRRRAKAPGATRYDRQKVSELGDKVLMTLKHAANIRAVQPDEFITVSITGTPKHIAQTQQIRMEPEGNMTVVLNTVNQQNVTPTFLTIRVKRADLDSFTGDKTDRDEFYDRFEITAR